MEALLTEPQAAKLIGVKPRTLRDMRQKGTGPRWVRITRFARYRPADIERWVSACRAVAGRGRK